jgi:hypothetical protein
MWCQCNWRGEAVIVKESCRTMQVLGAMSSTRPGRAAGARKLRPRRSDQGRHRPGWSSAQSENVSRSTKRRQSRARETIRRESAFFAFGSCQEIALLEFAQEI